MILKDKSYRHFAYYYYTYHTPRHEDVAIDAGAAGAATASAAEELRKYADSYARGSKANRR